MLLAKDLHRKGQLDIIATMEQLAKKIERQTNLGLASAFLTEGYKGYDCFAMIANSPEYQYKQGYVLYDLEKDEAFFLLDDEE